MKRKLKEMQEDADRIEKMQRQAEEGGGSSLSSSNADGRSIYIGSVCLSYPSQKSIKKKKCYLFLMRGFSGGLSSHRRGIAGTFSRLWYRRACNYYDRPFHWPPQGV
jgi:hypothetical protein